MNNFVVKVVAIKTSFSAIHCWPGAPDACWMLRNPHRHVFHVTMKWPVRHDDRDIEFITKKDEVTKFLRQAWDGQDVGAMSCENFCDTLMKKFDAVFVSVYEDDENGAEFTATFNPL